MSDVKGSTMWEGYTSLKESSKVTKQANKQTTKTAKGEASYYSEIYQYID